MWKYMTFYHLRYLQLSTNFEYMIFYHLNHSKILVFNFQDKPFKSLDHYEERIG